MASPKNDAHRLLASNIHGNERALAKLISVVENDPQLVCEIIPRIHRHLGNARTIGFTGPPGAGKSSLIDRVIETLKARERRRIGVIAVDPTSPFSHGALLGDRTRLERHFLSDDVFIRSMATRGSQGGLAHGTRHAIQLMDAYGMDDILVETVGVGQTELDIMEATQITVVILVPEAGDSIQQMKAGLMEIGDIFVINKSDRPNAEQVSRELKMILEMNPQYAECMPPVHLTQATTGKGVEEMVDSMDRVLEQKRKTGVLQQQSEKQRRIEFDKIFCDGAMGEFEARLRNDTFMQERLQSVLQGKDDPHSLLQALFPRGLLR